MAEQVKKKGKKDKKPAPPPARKSSYDWAAANAAIEERRTRETILNSGPDFARKRAEQKKTMPVFERLMADPAFAAKAQEVQDRVNVKRKEAEEKKAGAAERQAERDVERKRKEQDAIKLRALGPLLKPMMAKVPEPLKVLVVDAGQGSFNSAIHALISAGSRPSAPIVLVGEPVGPLPTIQETMEQLRHDLPELLPSAVIPVAMQFHGESGTGKRMPHPAPPEGEFVQHDGSGELVGRDVDTLARIRRSAAAKKGAETRARNKAKPRAKKVAKKKI